jgi:hypothetical protein
MCKRQGHGRSKLVDPTVKFIDCEVLIVEIVEGQNLGRSQKSKSWSVSKIKFIKGQNCVWFRSQIHGQSKL